MPPEAAELLAAIRDAMEYCSDAERVNRTSAVKVYLDGVLRAEAIDDKFPGLPRLWAARMTDAAAAIREATAGEAR